VVFLKRHFVDVDVIEPAIDDLELSFGAGSAHRVVQGDRHPAKVVLGRRRLAGHLEVVCLDDA
jgi:hypothetical protein